MASGGLSLPTTIAQAGDVARAQVKAQQTHQTTTPLSEQVAQSRDTKVQRVQKPAASDRKRVQEEERRRRDARRERAGGETEAQDAGAQTREQAPAPGSGDEDPATVGIHIDTRA